MEYYVCYRCGSETGCLRGVEMFCTKCRRKMFKKNQLKSEIEESLILGILESIKEQSK